MILDTVKFPSGSVADVLQAPRRPEESAGSFRCYHCDLEAPLTQALKVDIAEQQHQVCCTGCLAAVHFIKELDLESFYQYREQCNTEGTLQQGGRELNASELSTAVEALADNRFSVNLLIPDIRCVACVWLLEQSLKRLTGVEEISVNYATRRLRAVFNADTSALEIARQVQRLGYQARADLPDAVHEAYRATRRSMLTRLGVAGIGMMQVMMFAMASYLAADGIDPAYETLMNWGSLALTTPVVFYSAWPFHRAAWYALRNRTLIMDVPVSIAILAAWVVSTHATVTSGAEVYFDTAAMFTFFLLIGRYVELHSRYHFQQSQDLLTRLLPATASLVDPERAMQPAEDKVINQADIQEGDLLRVRPGEIIPADAVVVEGCSTVNEDAFTGEPLPLLKNAGSRVLAGAGNHDGELLIRVRARPEDFLIRQISRLYEQASQYRPRWSQLADRTASWFVAAVLLLSAGAGLYWYLAGASHYFVVSLTVLVVACPCALSLATPVAYTMATTSLRRRGVIMKNGAFLERAAETSAVVFDKTGTLTEASLNLGAVVPLGFLPEAQCLSLAAALESHSEHPIARAFENSAGAAAPEVAEVQLVPGYGVQGLIDGKLHRIGQPAFALQLINQGTAQPCAEAPDSDGLWVLLCSADGPLAWFHLHDRVRDNAADIISSVRAQGLHTAIFTGDHSMSEEEISRTFGADLVGKGMTPEQKVNAVRDLAASNHKVMMIGDGINDAGAMAAADTSLAIAPRDVLVQTSADATLIGDSLKMLPAIISFARRSRRIIRQNIGCSITYNFTVIPFALMGMVPPWLAALGMSLSSVVVILNSSRLHRLDTTVEG